MAEEAATLSEGMADIVAPSVLPLIVQVACRGRTELSPGGRDTRTGDGCSVLHLGLDVAAVETLLFVLPLVFFLSGL